MSSLDIKRNTSHREDRDDGLNEILELGAAVVEVAKYILSEGPNADKTMNPVSEKTMNSVSDKKADLISDENKGSISDENGGLSRFEENFVSAANAFDTLRSRLSAFLDVADLFLDAQITLAFSRVSVLQGNKLALERDNEMLHQKLQSLQRSLRLSDAASEQSIALEIERLGEIADQKFPEPSTRPKPEQQKKVEKTRDVLEQALNEAEQRKLKEALEKNLERKEKELEYIIHSKTNRIDELSQLRKEEEDRIQSIQSELGRLEEQESTHTEISARIQAARSARSALALSKRKKAESILSQIHSELLEPANTPITKAEILQRIEMHRDVCVSAERPQSTTTQLRRKYVSLETAEDIYAAFSTKISQECPFCKSPLDPATEAKQEERFALILQEIRRKKEALQKSLESESEKENLALREHTLKTVLNEIASLHISAPSSPPVFPRAGVEAEKLRSALASSKQKHAEYAEALEKRRQIEDLKKKIEEIQLQFPSYEEALASYRSELALLQHIEHQEEKEEEEKRQHLEKQNAARAQIGRLEETLRNREASYKEREEAQKQKQDIRAQMLVLESQIHEAETEMLQLETQIKTCRASKKEIRAQNTVHKMYLHHQNIHQQILARKDRVRALSDLAYTEEHRRQEHAVTEQLRAEEAQKDALQHQLDSSHRLTEEREQIEKKIRALSIRQKIEAFSVLPGDLTAKQTEISALESRLAQTQKEQERNLGELQALRKQQKENQDGVSLYGDAEQQELALFIRLRVAASSVTDLEAYQKGLESAIVKHHADKMGEINGIMQEIWGAAYKGGDIEKIKLVSSTDKSYALVMVKNGVEIEMRGRVSAGQKMLASIVVRLALAEAFGSNCGLLSLDEPTTNLDRDNILSLAASLAHIISERKKERSFQILVITHDEDFVRELLRTECAEHFYRISRDEAQNPRIEKVPIYNLK